jgi:serine phosphatase RsbU (regulator of sigma subunit)
VGQLIEANESFRIMTVDGLCWIDPFTGAMLPAPFGCQEVAKEHLLKTRAYTKMQPKPLAELQLLRWLYFLRDKFEAEPRIKVFHDDGRWLNPYNGKWEESIPLKDGKFTPLTLQAMAQRLTQCPEATKNLMLPAEKLEAIRRAANKQMDQAPTALWPAITAPPRAPIVVNDSPKQRESDRLPAMKKESDKLTAEKKEEPEEKTDLFRAKRVMEKMLHQLPEIHGFDLAIHYEPQELVGGDFYDVVELEKGKFLIVIGDVSGHGPEGALIVASALKALRYIAKPGVPLVDLMVRLNEDMHHDMPMGFFITMFAGILDADKRTLTCVCAGHHPALLCSLRRVATLQQVGSKGAAIGVLKTAQFKATMMPVTVQLEPGDTLLQFTDGIFEVYNSQDIEFGRLRTMGSCIANLEYPAPTMVSRMVKEVKKFSSHNLSDDLTLFALHVKDESVRIQLVD